MRNIVENSDFSQLIEILKKYVDICILKYSFYQIRCVLKVLTNTIDFQYLTVKPILNVQCISDPYTVIFRN